MALPNRAQSERRGSPPIGFEAVYRASAPSVMRVAACHGLDPDAAADVVSETFLLALESWDTFDPEAGPPTAWVVGIASNVIRRQRRAGWYRRRLFERSAFQRPALTERDVAEYAELRQQSSELFNAIADLGEAERDLLIASRVAGVSYAELERQYSTPASTLRKRISRTTANLKATLVEKRS